jgi:class 3 adenylate cyclase
MQSGLVEIGPMSIGHAVLEPGWRWSTSIGQVIGERSCQVHHISMLLSGRIGFEMEDGETAEFGPNTLAEIPPGHDAWVVGDETVVMLDFYGNSEYVGIPSEHLRLVTTILMSDIVDSTATAARLGDSRWRQLLSEHNRLVRARLDRFGAHEINTTGDGFIATVPSALAALRCAAAISAGVKELGLNVRIGVHTGEVEVVGDDLRGVAVHEAARIMALAGPAEVLTSSITRSLVEGSDLSFEDRGAQSVKGLDKPIQVFALKT